MTPFLRFLHGGSWSLAGPVEIGFESAGTRGERVGGASATTRVGRAIPVRASRTKKCKTTPNAASTDTWNP